MSEQIDFSDVSTEDAFTPKKVYDLSKSGDVFALVKDEVDESVIKKSVATHLHRLIKKYGLSDYHVA